MLKYFQDQLQKSREAFDKEYDTTWNGVRIPQFKSSSNGAKHQIHISLLQVSPPPANREEMMVEIFFLEKETERTIVYKGITEYLVMRNLVADEKKISDGFARSKKPFLEGIDFAGTHNLDDARSIVHHDTDMRLEEAFRYIDRWKQYRDLFAAA